MPERAGLGDPPETWHTQPPAEGVASGDPPAGGRSWQAQPPAEGAESSGPPGGGETWQTPTPPQDDQPSRGERWQAPPPDAASDGWDAAEPSWAPPPPPTPRPRQPQRPQSGYPQPSAYGDTPAYGAFAPAPAPPRGRRFWFTLSAVAAAVVVVLVAGTIGYFKFLNPNAVPPATGATVSTAFVQLKVTSNWSKSLSRSSELELTNKGDGEMLVGYGNSGQDGISSNQSALSNLETNLMFNTGNQVRQCVPQHGVSVGGKSGEEAGFRFSFQGTDLCEIAWVDYVSSSRYYFWNIGDDYSQVSKLQHDDAAMQETANWKV
ncbi:MAG: hypothetical protein J2P43_11405 [Candidatus Dormibacteraeota bacterium]|nr:hypothetical protein [Candidatus Dormibacteraeota bacterium]